MPGQRIAACIGSRSLSYEGARLCDALGEYLARNGWIIRTGNAPGADQCFAGGANRINPESVQLCLPWNSFERGAIVAGNVIVPYRQEWENQTAIYHPAWDKCSPGAKKLHSRNFGIIMGPPVVSVVIALPKPDGTGGTWQGIRIADRRGVPIVCVNGKTLNAVIMELELFPV